jgi:hypothetical protein
LGHERDEATRPEEGPGRLGPQAGDDVLDNMAKPLMVFVHAIPRDALRRRSASEWSAVDSPS